MIRKKNIVSFIKEKTGYVVSPDAMFDVQVRIRSFCSKNHNLFIYKDNQICIIS